MSFVAIHNTFRLNRRPRSGTGAIGRLWARRNLTAEERANLHALTTTPLAVTTASLGGHPTV
jgi:hypothetical protein